jgi:hypothetical protein
VECKTIDGTILEAWLWEVDGPAAMIVMSHGVSKTPIEFQPIQQSILNISPTEAQLRQRDEP